MHQSAPQGARSNCSQKSTKERKIKTTEEKKLQRDIKTEEELKRKKTKERRGLQEQTSSTEGEVKKDYKDRTKR